ncbi:MAG: VCBS repeat-containing protein, partial [Elusimicrobia bacterium]|nr:VCBS repeat-containing protein [Elusimicrobiota bacterium]
MKQKFGFGMFFAVFLFFLSHPLHAVNAPDSLLTDNQTNPIYVDTPDPTFSWSASTQCYYQLVVATSSDFGFYKWDTGRVTSTVKSCDYSGSYLSGNTTYYWKVRVWNVNLSSSVYSSTATFRMNFFIKKGSFESGQVVSLGRGDFDGDGKIDLALGTSGTSSLTKVYRNLGNWNFSLMYSTQYALDIGGVVVKDLNKDDLPDLITGVQIDNEGTNTASQIFLNDGSFNFHESAALNKKKTYSITVFDINRDGNYDIIEGLLSGGEAGEYNMLYNGSGAGAFSSGAQICESNNTYSIGVADFNDDGFLDLVCLNNRNSGTSPDYSPLETAIVYQGDGNGNFTKVWESPAGYFNAVAIGDIDNDGLCDFIAATYRFGPPYGQDQDSYVTCYYNTGNFNFVNGFEFAGPISRVTSLALTDVDNDGWLDLIMGWNGTSETKTRPYLNTGGTFSLLDMTEFSADAMSFAVGDFDNDGDLDYVAGTSNGCEYYYSTLADDGNSNFPPSAPSGGFSFFWDSGKLHLNWGNGTDNETPTALLQYNLKLRDESGTVISPEGGDVFSECDGFYGNMLTSTWTVLNVPRKTYFYSIQTIDAYGAESSFSAETTVNEKPYPGWDSENVIPSTGCRQYTKDDVLQDFSLRGCVTVDFKVKDFEKNAVTGKNFEFSLDGGNSWTALPEGSGALDKFYSPYSFYSSDSFSDAQKYTFTWNTTHPDDPSVLYSTRTLAARVRFKVNDGYSDSDFCESENFEIDNEKPTNPGDLTFNGYYTGQSLGLNFGSASFDPNFDEYIIYYNKTLSVNNVGDSIGEWNSSNDGNLAAADFNGASSTTITGLTDNTTYYFAIYAYDSFGNYNSAVHETSAKTNDIPSMAFLSVNASTTGTHLVTFSFRGSDSDANSWNYVSYQVRNKFGSYIDVTPETADPSYTSPLFFCSTGSVNTFVFNAEKALGAVSYDNALFKLTVTDGIDSSEVSTPLPFTIDTLPPSGITAFKVSAFKSSSVQLQWNVDDTGQVIQNLVEDNFWKYAVWWGTSPGVTNSAPFNCWGPENEDALGSASAISADVTGLDSGVKYYFRLFVYDAYGNIYSGDEVSQVTGAGPTSWFDSASQIPTGDGTVEVKIFCQHPDRYDIFGRLEYSTVSAGGPWYKATLLSTTEAYYNQTSGYFTAPPPEIDNSQYYQIGTSQNPIDTSTGTWTAIYLRWLSRNDIPSARYENVYLKTSVKDMNEIKQYSDDVTGPFVVDNLDPGILGCSYSHGDENYGTNSAFFSLVLNKEINSIDYSGIFISTSPFPLLSQGCEKVYLSTGEFLPAVSSSTLYFRL